jgi:hypothetical protein
VSGTPTIVEGNVPVSVSVGDLGEIVGGIFTGRMDQIVRESPSLGRIDIGDLYPEMLGIRPELTVALDLLAESLVDLDEASNAGSDILADDAVQRFQGRLPELFNCRNLSDSFGAIIGAVINALNNRRGDPLSSPQIRTLRNATQSLRSEPFMPFDAAVTEIMAIEDSGLAVEPEEFEVLADWLDE